MFNSISWQEFCLVIASSALVYYCLATLLLFRLEIISLFRGPSFKSQSADEVSNIHDYPSGVMGTIEQEEPLIQRTSVEIAREIEVFSSNDDPETLSEVNESHPTENGAMLIGSVADLLQEVKTLVELISEYKSPKDEGVSLFQTLILRYPHLRESVYQEPITLYIYEAARSRFHFHLELEHIRRWWTAGA